MLSLNDLRKLSIVLPPSEHVSLGEVGDIVSALIAHAAHGDPIIAAADEGLQAVHDFYYDRAVEHAAENGHDRPTKGQPVVTGPVTTHAGPPGGVSPAEFQALARQVQTLVDALTASAAKDAPAPPAAPAPAAPAVEPVPEVDEAGVPPAEPEPQPQPPATVGVRRGPDGTIIGGTD